MKKKHEARRIRSGRSVERMDEAGGRKTLVNQEEPSSQDEGRASRPRVKFEVYGEEMLDKEVKYSGNTGRIYLPPDWVGKHIKVIRTD